MILPAQPWDRIAAAYHRGDFKAYEHFLGKSKGWGQSRLETLKEIITKKDAYTRSPDRHLMYLFTLAIEPHPADEEKIAAISIYIDELEQKTQKSLLYQLTEEEAELSLAVLKYFPPQIREKVYRLGLKYQEIKCYETFFFGILKAMVEIFWTAQEKRSFLSEMFALLPPHTVDDLIYYFLKETSEKEQSNFFAVCSEDISAYIAKLRSEVLEYISTMLQNVRSQPKHISPNFKDNKNKYYLDLFYCQFKENEDADLIALGFSQDDWEYLAYKIEKERSSKTFVSLTMKWMIKVSQRLQGDRYFIEAAKKIESSLWLFYHHASKFVEKNKGWKGIPEQAYVLLAEAQNPYFLPRFFNTFDAAAQQAIVQHCVQQKPKNFLIWIDTILQKQTNWHDKRSDKLDKIFGVISKKSLMESALEALFPLSSSHSCMSMSEMELLKTREIALYCSLDQKYQKAIMQHLLQDKHDGLRHLSSWIAVIAEEGAPSKQGIFGNNFYKNLKEIDPAYPKELKEHLSLILSPGTDLFIDDLLPVDSELLSPEERQERAIAKLKRHFTTPNFPHEERRKFVQSFRSDLKLEDEDPTALVEKLFKEIPPDAWPLIFLHFENLLSNSFYSPYFEEKSKGGMAKKQRREAPPLMEPTQKEIPINEFAKEKLIGIANDPGNAHFGDIFTWYNVMLVTEPFLDGTAPPQKGFQDPCMLVDVCALTLLKMMENPLLKCDQDGSGSSPAGWAMQHLYQVVCEKNALHLVIRRFMDIAPAEKFIPIMDKFSSSCFFHNRDGLTLLLAECFVGANLDKFDYISKCLLDHYQSHREYSHIASNLLEAPIMADESEVATVGRRMIQSQGPQYLSYFFKYHSFNCTIIKALKNTDPDYCEHLFWDFLSVLTQMTNGAHEKLCIFQNFMAAYQGAGYTLSVLLGYSNAAPLIPIIKTWYEQKCIWKMVDTSLSDLTLLRHFRPEAFYPVVLREVRKTCDQEYPSFYGFDTLLKRLAEMGYQDEFISQLTERDPDLVDLIKNKIKEHFVDCLEQSDAPLGRLVIEWVPNWKDRLILWAQDTITQKKQESMQYGSDKPSYYELVRIYRTLERIGVLDFWLLDLNQALPEEMQPDLEAIYAEFEASGK